MQVVEQRKISKVKAMTKRVPRSLEDGFACIQPQMISKSPWQFGHCQSAPYPAINNAPDGMTLEQAQLIWSCAVELFTDVEITEILVDGLRNSSISQPSMRESLFNPENVATIHQDVFSAQVVIMLIEIAAKAPIDRIENQGSSVILRKTMWSHLTHHLLSIVVRSGKAPESLDELLLYEELGL